MALGSSCLQIHSFPESAGWGHGAKLDQATPIFCLPPEPLSFGLGTVELAGFVLEGHVQRNMGGDISYPVHLTLWYQCLSDGLGTLPHPDFEPCGARDVARPGWGGGLGGPGGTSL